MPAGSRRLPPLERGDQGISPAERQHAEAVTGSLLRATGVNWVASYDRASGLYEIRSRTGVLRFERWATPDGRVAFRVHSLHGENPVPSEDPRALRTLAEEVAAAGGVGRPVPHGRTTYPDILRRMSQLFDHRNAPDLVYVPDGGADPNHPRSGSHGVPDVTQSRAPLIVAGPGISRGAVTEAIARNIDVAPTVAQLIGVQPTIGTGITGVARPQLLRWQDGSSLVPALADASRGSRIANQAVMFVLDGLHQGVMLDEVARGNLPNIARLMRSGTTFANGTISDYPTVTWANHNTLLTGASPGRQGIINNSWYERDRGNERLITDGGFVNSLRTGRFLSDRVETLYEAVRRTFGDGAQTLALNQPSGRGASVSTLDLLGVGTLASNLPRIVREYLDGRSVTDPRRQDDKEYAKASRIDTLGTAIGTALWKRPGPPPKLTVFELTMTDNQGHHFGPHSVASRRAMQEADANVGRMLEAVYRRGEGDRTLFVVTSDHGMETQRSDKSSLGGWFKALKDSGVRTVESTRFVYLKTMRVSVHGERPQAGRPVTLAIRVANDDAGADGQRPAVAGAKVTIRDAHGRSWSAVADARGVARVTVQPEVAGELQLDVVDPRRRFTRESGTIDVEAAAHRRGD